MRVLYNNYVKSATISALTEYPGFDFDSALKDTRRSRIGRTLAVEDQTITFDLGAARAIDYIVIFNHNFTDSVTVTIQANSSDSWTTPPVEETLTISDVMLYEFSSSETYRYWRLVIDDATNTDGYLEISKVYIGGYLQMPYMSRDQEIPRASTSDVAESPGLQAYGDPGVLYSYGTINFPVIEDASKILMETMFNSTDKYIPYVLLVWENDLTSQPPLYARNTADFAFKRVADLSGKRWSLTFSFKETF